MLFSYVISRIHMMVVRDWAHDQSLRFLIRKVRDPFFQDPKEPSDQEPNWFCVCKVKGPLFGLHRKGNSKREEKDCRHRWALMPKVTEMLVMKGN